MRTGYRYGAAVALALALLGAWLAQREAPGPGAARDAGPPERSAAEPAPDPRWADRSDGSVAPAPDGAPRAAGASRDAGPRVLVLRNEPETGAKERGGSDDGSEAAPRLPIFLDALKRSSHAPTASIQGVDPHAPRELVAWRVKDGRRAIVARGHSERGGQLVFPELVVPRDGLEIVVTDADGAPGVPGASIARTLGGRDPVAPNAVVLDADGSDYTLRIVPNETAGEVLLADVHGAVFARYPVAATPLVDGRLIDVALSPGTGDRSVWFAHEFADGRRSAWREVALDGSTFPRAD